MSLLAKAVRVNERLDACSELQGFVIIRVYVVCSSDVGWIGPLLLLNS
jgi:hypothetical protein